MKRLHRPRPKLKTKKTRKLTAHRDKKRPRRKGCSHDEGNGVCRYYEKMSIKERLLRKKFFLDNGGVEEVDAHYLWSGIEVMCINMVKRRNIY